MQQLTDERPSAVTEHLVRYHAPVECLHCGGLIANVPAPPGVYGAWEGWFHLDPSREHFGRIGPR